MLFVQLLHALLILRPNQPMVMPGLVQRQIHMVKHVKWHVTVVILLHMELLFELVVLMDNGVLQVQLVLQSHLPQLLLQLLVMQIPQTSQLTETLAIVEQVLLLVLIVPKHVTLVTL
jgi:hypothetical protein